MSNENWNKGLTKQHLSEVTIDNIQVPVHVPKKVYNLIQYYCSKIKKDEWSGILFYTIKGSITKPKTLRIYCEDVYLMDVGSSTYTSFDTDTSIAKYMLTNKLLGCKMGLIHSHNNMRVFFSGEDMDELHTTAPLHNFYLSLIINNFGEAVAKIAFVGESEAVLKEKFYSRDENGERYLVQNSEVNIKKKKLYMYDCNVIQPKSNLSVNKNYEDRLSTVQESVKAAEEKRRATQVSQAINKATPSLPTASNPSNFNYFQEDEDNKMQNAFDDQVNEALSYEAFFSFCLSLGKFNPDDTVEDAITDIAKLGMNSQAMKDTILTSLPQYYCQFFNVPTIEDIDAPAFLEILGMFIDCLEIEELERQGEPTEFLTIFLPALRNYADKYHSTKVPNPNV